MKGQLKQKCILTIVILNDYQTGTISSVLCKAHLYCSVFSQMLIQENTHFSF